jgi:hypothetical protein
VLSKTFNEIIILEPFNSTEILDIQKEIEFRSNGDFEAIFKIENNFHLKVESEVSFINIKFIINTERSCSSDEVFNSISGGILKFKNCVITATSLTTITYRLFTINASLIVDNLLIKDIYFNIPGPQSDNISPILTPDNGNSYSYFNNLQLINISKTTSHDIITHRHKGNDFNNCIFENISHPGTVITLWFIFFIYKHLYFQGEQIMLFQIVFLEMLQEQHMVVG